MTEQKKVIWITGASSGIGEALALYWASPASRLILSGRNLHQLNETAQSCIALGAEVEIVPFDLANGNEIKEAVSLVEKLVPGIDVLVNNGGIGQRAFISDTSEEVSRSIMETDFWGHIRLTSLILPFLKAGGGCKIVVMSSLSGLFGFPQRAFYCAAKHALHGFFETLRLEHHKDNISVLMVCPGRIKTNISYHALTSTGQEHGQLDKGQQNGVSPLHVAKRIDRAIKKNKKQIVVGGKEVLMSCFKRFFPWLFYRIALRIDPNS